MSGRCQIFWDPQTGCYVVASGYNAKLVEGLKYVVPVGARHFDPKTKFWYLNEQYGEAFRKLAETIFGVGQVTFKSRAQTEANTGQARSTSVPATATTLQAVIYDFFNLVTYEDAKSLYAKTVMKLHPDRGGDGQKCAILNSTWSRIEKEFFKR
jgi:hypothetical protein